MPNILIIGASGYAGAELLKLLATRDDVAVTGLYGDSSVGKRAEDIHPSLSGVIRGSFESIESLDEAEADLAFVSIPSGASMAVVPRLLKRVGRVIDLGGDFRLQSPAIFERFYHSTHTCPGLLSEAVYGLPELNRKRIADAALVANPGCYATSAILALLPALGHHLISPSGIAIQSLSGTSGAGRASSFDLSFSELAGNVRAYKPVSHQHVPEIEQVLSEFCDEPVTCSFVPHLIPTLRGIYTTIQADLLNFPTADEIRHLYSQWYSAEPFIRVRSTVPEMKHILHTNFCDIGIDVDLHAGKLILVSTIDNLLKGAAGQAIQNMNLMFGLSETHSFLPEVKMPCMS